MAAAEAPGSGQPPAPFASAQIPQQGDQQGGPSVPGWPAGLMGPAGGGHGQHQGVQQGGPSVPGWPAGLMGPGGPVGFFNQPGMMSGMMGMMPGLARFQGMQGGGQSGAMQPGPGQNGASSKRGSSDFGEAEGNEKARKAPRRSLAATMERMEKHKILERRRRERTKELVGELLAVVRTPARCLGSRVHVAPIDGQLASCCAEAFSLFSSCNDFLVPSLEWM